jgi:macrolide transport system ATP-binding/permease protein
MMLSMRNIWKAYENLEVLKGIDLDIQDGEKIGIVGRNGAGKTTLAGILFGSLSPDGGAMLLDRETFKIGYMQQMSSYRVNEIACQLGSGILLEEKRDMLRAAGKTGLREICHWEEERFRRLSGGEKTRLLLADIFASQPDLLILDEPTNHLDFQGVDWLAGELGKYRGTLLIISHDRYFLDRTASRILEIEGGKATSFSGNYTFYRREKQRQFENQLHRYYEQEKLKAHIRTEIESVKSWSLKAHKESSYKKDTRKGKEFLRTKAKKMDRRVRSKIKRLERIETGGVERPREEEPLNFLFTDDGKHGRRIVEVKNVSKSFGERVLFSDASFYLLRGDKTGMLGVNGCGKTTLVKMLMGIERVEAGEIWVSPSVKITYVSQGVEDMNERAAVFELLDIFREGNTTRTRSVLACTGIGEDMLNKPLGQLSPGERMRVKIAGAILEGSNFLILDEPTNHLDLCSREQLEEALEAFQGTVLLISHDRYMLERICTRMLVFEDTRISKFEGRFREYLQRPEPKVRSHASEKKSARERRLVLEIQLAALVNMLGRMSREDPRYAELDQQYVELMGERRELDGLLAGR